MTSRRGNDLVSSVRVPPRREVILYEHAYFEGNSVRIKFPGESDLRRYEFNDVLSSSEIVEDLECELSCDGDTLRYCYTDQTYDRKDEEWFYGPRVTCVELGGGDATCAVP